MNGSRSRLREKDNIKLVYTVSVDCEAVALPGDDVLKKHGMSLLVAGDLDVRMGDGPISERPVVVGFGPAGMFCAMLLAEHGYRPIVIERGDDVDARIRQKESFYSTHVLDTESNIQFGARTIERRHQRVVEWQTDLRFSCF